MGISSLVERLYIGNQQRGFHQRTKAQGGFKDDVFSGEMHSLKAQKHFSPLFAFQKKIRGLTVAPHGDGFFLKESRIQKINLWCRPDAWYLTHPFSFLDQLPQT